jgi:hypothetical protein
MSKEFLTDAIIENKVKIANYFPYILFKTKGKFEEYSNILVIRLLTKKFAKFSIYPLKSTKIVKIILIGFDFQNKMIQHTIKKLKNYNIIHTSGLTSLKKRSYYECYLDISMSDKDYKYLKSDLDNVKNIFEDIKIVEIGLNLKS